MQKEEAATSCPGLFRFLGMGRLHGVHRAYGEEQRLAGGIVDAVIVGDDIAVAGCVDCKAFDLVDDIAVERLQVRNEVAHLFLVHDRQFPAERRGFQIRKRNAVELLELGGFSDQIVTLDDIGVVSMNGDFRQADPAFLRLFKRIAHGAPFFARRLVGDELDEALLVILPFALHSHPENLIVPFAHDCDAFEAVADLVGAQFLRQRDLLLDLALLVHVQQRVAVELVGIAFRSEPEAAFAIIGDAFDVELLGGSAVTGDRQGFRDQRGLLRSVDREDGRLRREDGIVDRMQEAGLVGSGKTGKRPEADGQPVLLHGTDLRIGSLPSPRS